MFSCEQEPGVEKYGEVLGEEVSHELVKGDKGMMLTFFPLSYYKTAKFVEHMSMFLHKDIKITINLNVQDIYDEDMLEIIFHYLKQADHPENFVFELVESEEVTDYQYIEQFAESIHNHGAKIAIDDFGSGFSNLLHIIKINADILILILD